MFLHDQKWAQPRQGSGPLHDVSLTLVYTPKQCRMLILSSSTDWMEWMGGLGGLIE